MFHSVPRGRRSLCRRLLCVRLSEILIPFKGHWGIGVPASVTGATGVSEPWEAQEGPLDGAPGVSLSIGTTARASPGQKAEIDDIWVQSGLEGSQNPSPLAA